MRRRQIFEVRIFMPEWLAAVGTVLSGDEASGNEQHGGPEQGGTEVFGGFRPVDGPGPVYPVPGIENLVERLHPRSNAPSDEQTMATSPQEEGDGQKDPKAEMNVHQVSRHSEFVFEPCLALEPNIPPCQLHAAPTKDAVPARRFCPSGGLDITFVTCRCRARAARASYRRRAPFPLAGFRSRLSGRHILLACAARTGL